MLIMLAMGAAAFCALGFAVSSVIPSADASPLSSLVRAHDLIQRRVRGERDGRVPELRLGDGRLERLRRLPAGDVDEPELRAG